ncbi:hypothetical protein VTJ83DRAFT_4612 [Remersonia thermophila]|uniref:PNPLA domain-containing protein n=1 Tax=Remersonia thermophila TaxID=72144 RepID=A0ABR4DAH1_9PEZI
MATPPARGAQIRVLCLDSGGVKVLSSLYILERLLYRIKPEDDPRQRIKPCDAFDIIVGSGMGGLLAIMLGVLEMDIQTCIECFTSLAQDVYTPRRRTRVGGALIHKLLGSTRYSTKRFQQLIRTMVRENHPDIQHLQRVKESSDASESQTKEDATQTNIQVTEPEDLPMLESKRRCKVFVCTMLENRTPYRIRSYRSKYEPGLPMTVWEAARATTATPGHFEPLNFKNMTTMHDGSFRNANPVLEVMSEIEHEFGLRDIDISCIVSIGAGVPKTTLLQDGLVDMAMACVDIASDAQATEALFRSTYATPGKPLHERYFRFEVEQGLQDVRADQWKKMRNMWSVTTAYLNHPLRQESLGKCAALLASDLPVGEALKGSWSTLCNGYCGSVPEGVESLGP